MNKVSVAPCGYIKHFKKLSHGSKFITGRQTQRHHSIISLAFIIKKVYIATNCKVISE
jgi:hypothetical protein